MINKHWNRWIFASASMAFKTKLGVVDAAQKFIVEGQNAKEATNYIELRMNGPTWYQSSRTVYLGDLIINLLARCSQDEKDFHKIFRVVGNAEAIFDPCIPIKKHGDGPDDDSNVIIGYMILQKNGEKDLETQHFGQVSPDLPMFESTVEGMYRAEIALV